MGHGFWGSFYDMYIGDYTGIMSGFPNIGVPFLGVFLGDSILFEV